MEFPSAPLELKRTFRRFPPGFAAVLLGGALLTAPGSARAEPGYPEAVQEAIGLECVPSCRLCHTREAGGLRFVSAFGQRIWALGLRPSRPETVISTLECMRAQNCEPAPGQSFDTDGDGTSDIEELDRGQDPGRAGNGSLCGPAYGCGARLEPHGTLGASAIAAVLAALAGVAFTRARRRSKPRY